MSFEEETGNTNEELESSPMNSLWASHQKKSHDGQDRNVYYGVNNESCANC